MHYRYRQDAQPIIPPGLAHKVAQGPVELDVEAVENSI